MTKSQINFRYTQNCLTCRHSTQGLAWYTCGLLNEDDSHGQVNTVCDHWEAEQKEGEG